MSEPFGAPFGALLAPKNGSTKPDFAGGGTVLRSLGSKGTASAFGSHRAWDSEGGRREPRFHAPGVALHRRDELG